MLGTLDTLVAFVVIMTVLSLLITVFVQMASAALSLRGKNLANALSLTFQSIDPQLGNQAYRLADHILKDPVLSDSLFRPKDRPLKAAPTLLRKVAVQAADEVARLQQMALTVQTAAQQAPEDPLTQAAAAHADLSLQAATNTLQTDKQRAEAALQAVESGRMPTAKAAPSRTKPWGFLHWNGFRALFQSGSENARHLATAVRPEEVYRLLRDLSALSDDEATQRGIAGLNEKAAYLLKALGVPDALALEAREKLVAVAQIAALFTNPEQKRAVLDSLTTFGVTVEFATAQAYDHFQRWFGSAQDRAEQWFQAHTRNVTIVFAILLAFCLQVDTVEVFHRLRDSPGIVQALVKSTPNVVAAGDSVAGLDHQNVPARLTYLRWLQRHPLYALPEPLPAGSSSSDYQEALSKRSDAPPDPAYALGEYDDAYANAKAAAWPSPAPVARTGKPASNGGKAGLAYQAYLAWAAKFPDFALPSADLAKLDRAQDDAAPTRAVLAQQLQRAGAQEAQDKTRQTTFIDDYNRAAVEIQQENLNLLKNALDQTGFDLVPSPFLHRWQHENWADSCWRHFLPHLIGMAITAALLALGAPFWFNLLKNLMSLRPAVASLIEKRPHSAPALPQTPPTPGPPS